MKYLYFALSACLVLVACGAEEAPAEAAEETTNAEATVTEEVAIDESEVEDDTPPDEESLPIAEDFEEEVATQITEDNFEAALAEIEGELANVQ